MSSLVWGVSASPKLTDLPGSQVLQQLVDGAQAWGLVIALLGVFVGAALWAVGTHGHNPVHAARGRTAALVSAGAALLIGGGPGLINFFSGLGAQVK